MRKAQTTYTVLFAVALLITGLWFFVLGRSKADFMIVSSRVEFTNPGTVPLAMEVGPNGSVYTVTKANGGYEIVEHSSDGQADLRSTIPTSAADTGILVSSAGINGSAYVDTLRSATRCSRVTYASVGADRRVVARILENEMANPYWIGDMIPTAEGIVAVGKVDYQKAPSFPVVFKLAYSGRQLWKTIEKLYEAEYTHVALDRHRDIIVAGDIGSGMGTCLAKYSPQGKKLWSKYEAMQDGGSTMWMGVGKNSRILTIVQKHDPETDPSVLGFLNRRPEYVIVEYAPDGKLLDSRRLSRGRDLQVQDAAMNSNDDLLVISNRRRDGNAVLTKFDSGGQELWSGVIRLPRKCTASQMKVAGDSIYVLGRWPGYTDTAPPLVRSFIYRVEDKS